MTDHRAISINNQGYSVESPEACPICHRYSEIQAVLAEDVRRRAGVEVVYRCAYQGCRSFFVAYYGPPPQGTLLSIRPIKPQSADFPESVSKISPTFIIVFAEAEEAAQLGLSQIAGPGYRKAFEFLIKDYAISLAPDKADDIKKNFSGTVVTDYISDSRIQQVAKRTLWLGNDETHYLRKWESHDVKDLIALIKLTTNWIDIDHLSKAYVEQMPG
jgi:hypothetical protein